MTIAVISGRRYSRGMASLPSPARALTLSEINADYARYLRELEDGGAIVVYSDDRLALLGVLTRRPGPSRTRPATHERPRGPMRTRTRRSRLTRSDGCRRACSRPGCRCYEPHASAETRLAAISLRFLDQASSPRRRYRVHATGRSSPSAGEPTTRYRFACKARPARGMAERCFASMRHSCPPRIRPRSR
jgi:hypothetical protein